jgi:hypothetical protein
MINLPKKKIHDGWTNGPNDQPSHDHKPTQTTYRPKPKIKGKEPNQGKF